ncbi:MAG TPA: ribonuclease HII [bacterium]|nr:ribonuclease HII [bacterium]
MGRREEKALNRPKEIFERLLSFDRGYRGVVAGVDEAGRGPWAGPVVAAAVILDPAGVSGLEGVDDSKKLSEKKREAFFDIITSASLCYAISEVSNRFIDEQNILSATLTAMKGCIEKLSVKPEIILIDGTHCPKADFTGMEAVKDGDAKSLSIAAASILAKVHRDRAMRNFDKLYPGYGFSGHKGYGTAAHAEAIKKLGICPIHRVSYKPVKEFIDGEGNKLEEKRGGN